MMCCICIFVLYTNSTNSSYFAFRSLSSSFIAHVITSHHNNNHVVEIVFFKTVTHFLFNSSIQKIEIVDVTLNAIHQSGEARATSIGRMFKNNNIISYWPNHVLLKWSSPVYNCQFRTEQLANNQSEIAISRKKHQ